MKLKKGKLLIDQHNKDYLYGGKFGGNYVPETLKLISNKKIIQAIKVKKEEDINLYKQYIGVADEFLFDSSAMEKSSVFDWSYLKNIEINEWFLAGGININNIEKASRVTRKIDINSGLEDNPGVKSVEKIKKFLLKVKEINENRTI